MLSCSCNDHDGDGWYYYVPHDFSVLNTKRRKRCVSCKALIDVGSECVLFNRSRDALTDIEERIYGQEVGLAPYYMCGKCGEQFLNLSALGYCVNIPGNVFEALEEYWEMAGFRPKAASK